MNQFLASLGVTVLQQLKKPVTSALPYKFNPYAASVWMNVCNALDPRLSVEDAWSTAVEMYMEQCARQGTYPLRATSTMNEDLREYLVVCHKLLTQYLKNVDHPLMDEYKVLEIDRDATINQEGFSLKVRALFKNDDPTFEQHLKDLGFEGGSKLSKSLSEGVQLSFSKAEGANRWYVQYMIKGPHIPEQLAGGLTNDKLEKILVVDIWYSLTKELRPAHAGPRFI